MKKLVSKNRMKEVLCRIKKIRIEKGYKQESIANELEISQSTYAKIEKGQQKLSLEMLFAITEILDVTVLDLF